MNKKLSTIVLGCLFVIAIHAQPPAPPKPSAEMQKKHLSKMEEQLKLSPEQNAKFETVFKNFFDGMQSLHEKMGPPPPPPPMKPEDKAQMDKLVKERDEALQKILTPDQFKRFKEMDAKHGHLKPPPPPPADTE